MSLATADTLNPRVHFNQILRGPANITATDLERRLVKFEYSDDRKNPNKVTMEFDNSDGVIVNFAVLMVGLKIRLTFGYDALRSRTFDVTVYKVKGTMVRSPSTISPAPTAAGVVTMEGKLRTARVNRNAHKDVGHWKGVKMSQVASQIARSLGYRETKIFVEPKDADGNPEPRLEEVTIPKDMTYKVFMEKRAAELGFDFDMGRKEFHFHSEGWKKSPTEQIEYFYGPDLLDFSFDGDWKVNMARVRVGGLDPKRRKFFIDVRTGKRGVARVDYMAQQKRPGASVEDVIRAIPEKKRISASRRMASLLRRKWAINLTLVGNPRVLRGMRMTLGNFGPLIDGDWYVRGCKHVFDESGYTTTLKLRAKSGKGGSCPRRLKFYVDPATGKRGVAGIVCRITKGNKGRKGRRKKSRVPSDVKAGPFAPTGNKRNK
jgi:phage protein D